MKVAVYSIALNEQRFVERWVESAREADVLLIADTGSSDRTVEIAQQVGVDVVPISVNPWRFDDARNASLACLPSDVDYCIALDLDEVLLPGWREALLHAHRQGVNRPRYTYIWSFDEQGKPGLTFSGNKIHARHGFRWMHAAHEVLMPDRAEERQGWCDLEIHHLPDQLKSRSHYLELLELDVFERPHDARSAYYFARELMFVGRKDDAISEFQRFLALPDAIWVPQRSEARRYIAACETDVAQRVHWLNQAAAEDQTRREPLVDLAQLNYELERWPECLEAAERALAIVEKNDEFGVDGKAWGWLPHDLAAIAAHNLGLQGKALAYGLEASALNPRSERLRENLRFYQIDS